MSTTSRRLGRRRRRLVVALLGLPVVGGLAIAGGETPAPRVDAAAASVTPAPPSGFVDSKSCRPCHLALYDGYQHVGMARSFARPDPRRDIDVAFKFKNVSDRTLTSLQANVVFRHAADDKEWGSFFLKITGSEGLAVGATSESHRVNSPLGYTGTESRQQMLQNSLFADAKQLAFDGEGRIMLPEALCAHAKLTEAAAFAGRGRYFEIWEPQALEAYKAEARQRAADKQRTLRQQGPEGSGR